MVGDPLYRPFRQTTEDFQSELEARRDPQVEWTYAMLADRTLAQGKPLAQVAQELGNLPLTQRSAVLSEKFADLLRLQGQTTAAKEAYEQAIRLHPSPQQKVRLYLTLAALQQSTGAENQATRTLKLFLALCPDYPARKAIWEQILISARRLGDNSLVVECEKQLNPNRTSGQNNLPSRAP